MITTLVRIIKYGFQNFVRNGWLSTATIAVMFLALLVFQGVTLFSFIAGNALSTLQEKIDISVYFKLDAPEDEVLNTKNSLEGLNEVKDVEYISREQALEEFKLRHEGDTIVTQALEELGDNPLSASLNIKAKDPREYVAIAAYLNNESLNKIVDHVTYNQNQIVIERLINIVDASRRSGIILAAVLSLIAVLVTFNTIRLAIYSSRQEIGVMRLVGSSHSFIQGPFIVEGAMAGFLAATVSMIVSIPLVSFASPYIAKFIPGTDLLTYFNGNFAGLLSYQILAGVTLGVFSSFVAVRRYLRA